jgi:hypothetical protein
MAPIARVEQHERSEGCVNAFEIEAPQHTVVSMIHKQR